MTADDVALASAGRGGDHPGRLGHRQGGRGARADVPRPVARSSAATRGSRCWWRWRCRSTSSCSAALLLFVDAAVAELARVRHVRGVHGRARAADRAQRPATVQLLRRRVDQARPVDRLAAAQHVVPGARLDRHRRDDDAASRPRCSARCCSGAGSSRCRRCWWCARERRRARRHRRRRGRARRDGPHARVRRHPRRRLRRRRHHPRRPRRPRGVRPELFPPPPDAGCVT